MVGIIIVIECPSGRWGQDCLKHCDCRNGGKCDFETGVCRFPVNWTGSKCELPCEEVSSDPFVDHESDRGERNMRSRRNFFDSSEE